jgi:hypothetical protein
MSPNGPQRRFAAVQYDACNGGRSRRSVARPAPPHLTQCGLRSNRSGVVHGRLYPSWHCTKGQYRAGSFVVRIDIDAALAITAFARPTVRSVT